MRKIFLLLVFFLIIILLLAVFGGKKIVSPLPEQPVVREMFEPKVRKKLIINEEKTASPTVNKSD